MKQQNNKIHSKKKIADEILYQIGGSVIFVLILIAAVSICMTGWLSITAKETELVQESNAAANQLTGFLEQYTKSVEQLAANPEKRRKPDKAHSAAEPYGTAACRREPGCKSPDSKPG